VFSLTILFLRYRPVQLLQCVGDGDICDVSVEKAFIAALAVPSEENTIEIDGMIYPMWGAVEAIINWSVLVQKSGLYERFERDNRSFRLTRTDRIFNQETGEVNEQVSVALCGFFFSN
jgi:hypothetical protein